MKKRKQKEPQKTQLQSDRNTEAATEGTPVDAEKDTKMRPAESQKQSVYRKAVLRYGIMFIFILILISAMYLLSRPVPGSVPTSYSKLVFVPAIVTDVEADDAEPEYIRAEGRRLGTQEIEIRILRGEHKGEHLYMTNYLSVLGNVDVKEGTRIVVRMIEGEDGTYYPMMYNYDRGRILGGFVLIFFFLLSVIGGKKGVKALLGLLFTLVCLWFLLVPMMMRGFQPMVTTIFVTAVTAAVSLLLIDGFSKKTYVAVLGCIAGVTVAGLSAALVGALTPLNGFNMSEAEDLMLYATDDGLVITGLLVCGIIIAALGAVMDVAMAIASSIHELHSLKPDLSAKDLFMSGMNIGKDAMGTMANTLILAFVGSSLNTLILIQAYEIPFLQLINTDFICIEILQGVAGSLGIILTVPLVAFIGARMMTVQKDRLFSKQ